MNYGIGNVKGKSSGGGGGGIPVITLQASQMISQTQIQFTEEQYNTIVANGAFYLDLLGSQQLLMTCVNASNLADIQCYNISQTGSGLQLATIDLNKTTYIGVLGVSPYPQAKQLYQHNIRIYNSGNLDYIYLSPIVCDRATKFTLDDLCAYLYDRAYQGYDKGISCSGWQKDTNNDVWVYDNLQIHATTFGYAHKTKVTDGTLGTTMIMTSLNYLIDDLVKSL